MKDLQAARDDRGIAISEAGIRGLRSPAVVYDRAQGKQSSVAEVSAGVSVAHDVRGTHMSRLVEAVHEFASDVRLSSIPMMLAELQRRLGAASASIEFRFPHFLDRCAPVTGARGLVAYEARISGRATGEDQEIELGVCVPVTCLCPCSKAISDYGAHNQRALIDIEATLAHPEEEMLWVDELVSAAESSASAPVYSVLKRPDERFVTMQAYDNPRFVEDMARDVLRQLSAFDALRAGRVGVVSQESIHDHQAFANVSWTRS